ncbi:hypothetical protein [Mesorhizobium sp. CO1-1-8]|uniref:hypothetical protein n=1 Tax=Mesorhizobium sp. CO1-1-8 TaxID=2876631 RepID=UPI001CD0C720|nr:hypothetical protein [Mesorhizobium sp. CO1-1-8]MBZ9775378.1 hypothetical protein [Mesorhizobium sp. CO1-1-8]
MFEKNTDTLRSYVKSRNQIETYLTNGDLKNAIDLVDGINSSICWSIEMLGLRVALTRALYGLEAQKSWINSKEIPASSLAPRFFTYWLGVRSEEYQNPLLYADEMRTRVNQFEMSEQSKIFLRYHLFNDSVEDIFEADLIAAHTTHSILDQYECCVQLARTAAAEMRISSEFYYRSLLPFMQSIEDRRFQKLSFAFGHIGSVNDIISRTYAADQYALDRTRARPKELNDLEAALALRGNDFGSDIPTNLDPVVYQSIRNISQPGQPFTDGHTALSRYALLYPNFEIGLWCKSLLATLDTASVEYRHSAYVLRFLATSAFEPFVAPHLPEPLTQPFLDSIQRRFEAGPVTAFYNAASSAPPSPSKIRHGSIAVHEAALVSARNAKDLSLVYEYSSILRVRFSAATRETVQCEVLSLLALERITEAVEVASAIYRQSSELVVWLPLKQLASALNDSVVGREQPSLALAEVLWLLAENVDREFRSSVVYAIENYLECIGISQPSDMPIDDVRKDAALRDFLFLYCSRDVLALSLNYADQQALEDERIRILTLLRTAHPDSASAYEDKITAILRQQEIGKALASLQRSKISMDEEQIREWGHKTIKDKFERFRALVDAGMSPVSADYADELLDSLAKGETNTVAYQIPDNEPATLFAEIFYQLCRECSLNAKHGINSYLSLRIRHGTISGQLRRPSQEQHLLSMVGSDDDEYAPNIHWYDALKVEIGENPAASVSYTLASFSKDYDELIERFTSEYVQIKRPEKPNGLIEYRMRNEVMVVFSAEASSLSSFDIFFDEFLKIYWIHIGQMLAVVRSYIDTDLRDQFGLLFERLRSDSVDAMDGPPVPMLNDALLRARSGLNESITEMSTWFDVPQTIENSLFAFADLVEIGKEMVRRLNPEFNPRVSIVDRTDIKLSNALVVFTDALFILFGNVEKHSGMISPRVDVDADLVGDCIQVRFVSDCDDIEVHRASIEAAMEKMHSADHAGDVSREGGTGFPKLAKVMSFSRDPTPIEFSIDAPSSRFAVILRFSARIIEPKSEGANFANLGG